MGDGKREQEVLRKIVEVLVRELAPEKICLFGSRAKKKNAPSSDFDLALDCTRPLPEKMGRIRELVEEVSGLYSVDIIFIPELEPDFLSIVLTTGKLVYDQKKRTALLPDTA